MTDTTATTAEDDIRAVLALQGRELDAACDTEIFGHLIFWDAAVDCETLQTTSDREPWRKHRNAPVTEYSGSLDTVALLRAELTRRGLMLWFTQVLVQMTPLAEPLTAVGSIGMAFLSRDLQGEPRPFPVEMDCVAQLLNASPTTLCQAALLTVRAAKRAGRWQ